VTESLMRDRKKELIRQWLKEPTGSEQEFCERVDLAPHHGDRCSKPPHTFSCSIQERERLNCVENSRKTKHDLDMESHQHVRRWYEPSRVNKSPLHGYDHERSKYKKMLVQFLESQNQVFCFPSQLNSFQRMLVHVEAGKLGLEHRSCGQGWERFIVVTKPGNWKETGKSENFKSGENECCDVEELMSNMSIETSNNLPSLASKLFQVVGRCPQTVQNENLESEVKLNEGTGNNKEGDYCKDNSQKDQNQSNERRDATQNERIEATVPSSALPDDPNEIERLRAEFEKTALIIPEDVQDFTSDGEAVLISLVRSSGKQPPLKDTDVADDRRPVAATQPCTLTMPLPGCSPVDESLLQKVTDDLAWFENLVSIKAVGQVVEAMFANEEFADTAIRGLKAKYPGISKKENLRRHPSSGLFTLSFFDTERLRYRATMHHFSAFGEVPVILRGSKRDEVTVGFKTEEAAALALSASKRLSSFMDIQNIVA